MQKLFILCLAGVSLVGFLFCYRNSFEIGTDFSDVCDPAVSGANSVSSQPSQIKMNGRGRIVQYRYAENIDAHEYLLSNGMKVIYKQSASEADELALRAIALGGYSELPSSLWSSAKTSQYLLGDSVFDERTQTGFTRFLTYSDIDLNVELSPYHRSIMARARAGSIKQVLQAIHMLFVEDEATEELFALMKQNHLNILQKKKVSPQQIVEWGRAKLNNINADMLCQRCCDCIHNANYSDARDFWRRATGTPEDYFIFISGNIGLDILGNLLECCLASIPSKNVEKLHLPEALPAFSEGIQRQKIEIPEQQTSRLVYTFPLQKPLNASDLHILKFSCYLLEDILEDRLKQLDHKGAVHVSYEQPYAPMLNPANLVIRFESTGNFDSLEPVMLAAIETLRLQGPHASDFEKTYNRTHHLLRSLENPDADIFNLLNIYLSQDPALGALPRNSPVDIASVKNFFFSYLTAFQYTELLSTPK